MSECWAITNGAAGNERQALALAAHMGLPVRSMVLQPRAPWSWLGPRMTLGARLAVSGASRAALVPPWPALAIGCGRDAALFTRMLRQLSDGRCRAVQILDPRIAPRHWDLVIAPRHDQLSASNVLNPLGSLNPVDDEWLASGREACAHLADLPQPRTAVLLGGPRHAIALDQTYARALADAVRVRWRRDGGSVMVLASRRTPGALLEGLRQALHDVPGLIWSGANDGANPYPGVLGWADRVVVTPDSVNMLSEACAIGRPVHTLALTPLPDKLARFHAALREQDLLHAIDADPPPTQTPLRETTRIAAEVCRRLHLPTAVS